MNLVAAFLSINYIAIIPLCLTGLEFAVAFIILIATDRPTSFTVTNLLAVNVSVVTCFFLLSCMVVPYLGVSTTATISCALMLPTITRLFFIVFHLHRQLLGFKTHMLLIPRG